MWLGIDSGEETCEYSNEYLGSVKGRESLDQLTFPKRILGSKFTIYMHTALIINLSSLRKQEPLRT
jgi:hypothetical protein